MIKASEQVVKKKVYMAVLLGVRKQERLADWMRIAQTSAPENATMVNAVATTVLHGVREV